MRRLGPDQPRAGHVCKVAVPLSRASISSAYLPHSTRCAQAVFAPRRGFLVRDLYEVALRPVTFPDTEETKAWGFVLSPSCADDADHTTAGEGLAVLGAGRVAESKSTKVKCGADTLLIVLHLSRRRDARFYATQPRRAMPLPDRDTDAEF